MPELTAAERTVLELSRELTAKNEEIARLNAALAEMRAMFTLTSDRRQPDSVVLGVTGWSAPEMPNSYAWLKEREG